MYTKYHLPENFKPEKLSVVHEPLRRQNFRNSSQVQDLGVHKITHHPIRPSVARLLYDQDDVMLPPGTEEFWVHMTIRVIKEIHTLSLFSSVNVRIILKIFLVI